MVNQRRSRARQYALQAIYQWQMTGQDVGLIQDQFLEDEELAQADVEFFVALLHGIPAHLNHLDQVLTPLLDRTLDRIDPVELAVLRIGTYELLEQPDIPYRVIINEAIELAKMFGSDKGHRYVNGVLDRLAQHVRSEEAKPRIRPKPIKRKPVVNPIAK
jgi:N utilization substance protein B